jgi:hypothetical protein
MASDGSVGAEILIREARDRRAYRLRCRFVLPANPRPEWVEKEKYRIAERFIADMRKQGWEHLPRHGFQLSGPFPPTPEPGLPRSGGSQWHAPSRDLLSAVADGRPPRARRGEGLMDGIHAVPVMGETDGWEYELAGVFTHPEILTEVPDRHEERRD